MLKHIIRQNGPVTVVDMNARKTLKTITMPEGSKPMGLAVAPDGQRVYVSNGRGGTLSVLDVATDSILSTTKVGTRPWGVGVTKDGKKLYTANGPGNDVSVIDASTMPAITSANTNTNFRVAVESQSGTLNLGMRLEYLMARLQVPMTQAVVKEPNKVKFRDYLRFHETDQEDIVLDKPEQFAALYGAVRKQDG